jgi:hypothetical protein
MIGCERNEHGETVKCPEKDPCKSKRFLSLIVFYDDTPEEKY